MAVKFLSGIIATLVGYTKPASTSAISASDTITQAIGKLEKGLDGKANLSGATFTGAVGSTAFVQSSYANPCEFGQYLDMHASGSSADYDVRFEVVNGYLNLVNKDYTTRGKGQTGAVVTRPNIIWSNATHTFAITEAMGLVCCINTSDITVTVPLNTTTAFDIGTTIEYMRLGTGEVYFTGETGVVIASDTSYRKIKSQYTAVKLTKVNTNDWILTGSLKA